MHNLVLETLKMSSILSADIVRLYLQLLFEILVHFFLGLQPVFGRFFQHFLHLMLPHDIRLFLFDLQFLHMFYYIYNMFLYPINNKTTPNLYHYPFSNVIFTPL